jgi:hypothetical protein
VSNPSNLNQGNIFREVYDNPTRSLKVNLVGSGTPSLPNVVRLTDGTGYLSSTVDGAKRALDVNVINNIELSISHLDDSISLGDGSGLLTTTVEGSKRALDVSLLGGELDNVSGDFTQSPTGISVTTFNSASLPSLSSTVLVQYTVPAGNPVYLQKLYLSGDTIGKFTVKINAGIILVIRLSYTNIYQLIDLATNTAFGIPVSAGDIISIEVDNVSNGAVVYDATIQTMNT